MWGVAWAFGINIYSTAVDSETRSPVTNPSQPVYGFANRDCICSTGDRVVGQSSRVAIWGESIQLGVLLGSLSAIGDGFFIIKGKRGDVK